MAAKEFIIAIELGSSKITGIAGRKNKDGSIQVLAVVREGASSCIRKGVVYNIDKTSACLTRIVKQLKTQLKSEISQVYVGVGGQSIRSIPNSIAKTLADDAIISQELVNELMDNNRSTQYPDLEILDAVTQEFKVGTLQQIDPVGIQSDKIEGHFLNIVCRKAFFRNLNKCFDQAKITIAEMYLSPVALAHSVLTDSEMHGGCLLVDLGADTTTVSVYYKNILRHLAVIPLGGNNITKDLTTLLIEEDKAEAMKIEYGKAYVEATEIDTDETLPIDAERSVPAKAFNALVEARVNEIIQNVWFGQVPQKYTGKLMGGIILTGGGAMLKEMKKAFAEITGIKKVRIAGTVRQEVSSTDSIINAHNGMMTTALGLLAKGDMNCAGSALKPAATLFDTNAQAAVAAPDVQNERSQKPSEPGRVESPEEKLRRHASRQQEDKPAKATAPAQPKESLFARGYKFLLDLGKAIISAEDEDSRKH